MLSGVSPLLSVITLPVYKFHVNVATVPATLLIGFTFVPDISALAK